MKGITVLVLSGCWVPSILAVGRHDIVHLLGIGIGDVAYLVLRFFRMSMDSLIVVCLLLMFIVFLAEAQHGSR